MSNYLSFFSESLLVSSGLRLNPSRTNVVVGEGGGGRWWWAILFVLLLFTFVKETALKDRACISLWNREGGVLTIPVIAWVLAAYTPPPNPGVCRCPLTLVALTPGNQGSGNWPKKIRILWQLFILWVTKCFDSDPGVVCVLRIHKLWQTENERGVHLQKRVEVQLPENGAG